MRSALGLMLRCLPCTKDKFEESFKKPEARHHHFTVFSGRAATAQSARSERSYLRDYVREDEARALAKQKDGDAIQQAVTSGINGLKQALSEELDKLEGRLEGGEGRRTRAARFELAAKRKGELW